MFIPKLATGSIPDQATQTSAAAQAAVTGSPPVLPRVDPLVLKLNKSLQTHGGQVNELRFREPVGNDYAEIGQLPFDIRGDSSDRRVVVDFKLASKWIAALVGHDEIVVGGLPRADFLAAVSKMNDILMGAGVDKVGNSGA